MTVATNSWRDKAMQSIRKHEGYREYPYKDSKGLWTVGIGHLIHYDQLDIPEGSTVSFVLGMLCNLSQHLTWFESDFQKAVVGAQAYVGAGWEGLTPARKAVLTEMAFQMGAAGLAGFVKARTHIVAGRWAEAAKEMRDSRWARIDTPTRALRLTERFARNTFTE